MAQHRAKGASASLASLIASNDAGAGLDDDDRRFCEAIELLKTSPAHAPWYQHPLCSRRGDGEGGGAQLILAEARANRWPSPLPANLRRQDAIMGVDLPDAALKEIVRHSRHTPLTPGEVGILMSNQRAWEHAIDHQWEWTLIMEDDAVVQLDGGLIQLLALLPTLVESATAVDPDWQLLVLSPHGLEDFYACMHPDRIPTLISGASVPSWAAKPLRMDGTGWRRVGPTFHAFGWIYRAPLMRKLLSSFKRRKPLLNPLDVWVWEVMAANGMLGRALSPDLIDYGRLTRSSDPKAKEIAEFKAALVSTSVLPGQGNSLRGYNEGLEWMANAKQNANQMGSLKQQMANSLGLAGADPAMLANVMKSMAHMLPPEMQALAQKISVDDIAAQLQAADGPAAARQPGAPDGRRGPAPSGGVLNHAEASYTFTGRSDAPQGAQAETAERSETTLVALLASHVSNGTRLNYLGRCLRSIMEQTELPRMVVVGLSCTDDIRAKVRKLMHTAKKDFEAAGGELHFVFSEARLAQFEHYRATLPHLAAFDGQSTWVIFGDDDDIWHPRRAESYAAAAREASGATVAMASPVYAINTRPLPAQGRLDGKDLTLVRCEERAGGADNYWGVMARLHLWRGYFEETPPVELKSIYSDVHFSLVVAKHLKHGQRTRAHCIVLPRGEDNWMYLWRQDHAGNPQHTEQQKSKLRPIVKDALVRFFSAPPNKKRFCAEMAEAIGLPALDSLQSAKKKKGRAASEGGGAAAAARPPSPGSSRSPPST